MTVSRFRPASGGNCLIDEVIAAPLEAAARANSNMAHEQLAFVLKYCFEQVSDGKYLPRMIDMTISRHELVETQGGECEMVSIDATIHLPIITIVPLSSLAVEKIEIDFDLEITSMESGTVDKKIESKGSSANTANPEKHGVNLRGKIGPARSKVASSNRKDHSKANLEIKLTAGSLPLPSGILSLIDSFGKHITPHDVKPKALSTTADPTSDTQPI